MLSLIRRLFRRTPPHLVGRVPVDAGVGVARDDYRVGHGPKIRPEVLGVTYDHGPSVRQYEQAPLLANGARPDWAMRDPDMQRARIREAERARQQDGTTEPLWTAMRDFWAQQSPRPSPAENAKRYSKPEWTW